MSTNGNTPSTSKPTNALRKVDDSGDYIVETNVDIPLSGVGGECASALSLY